MVKIFSLKNCHYCDKLKAKLEEANLEYEDKDIDDNKQIFDTFVKYYELDGSIPVILVNKKVIAPNVSFKTIDQAFEIIKKLI